MSKKLVLIESEGLLYRGPTANHPTEVWVYPRGGWAPYGYAGQKEKDWGKQITARRAARLKKNNPAAEHFKYYDTPPWSQPLSEAYLDSVMPEHVRKRIARLRIVRGSQDE